MAALPKRASLNRPLGTHRYRQDAGDAALTRQGGALPVF